MRAAAVVFVIRSMIAAAGSTRRAIGGFL